MEAKYYFGGVCIACITALEVMALYKEVDGQYFATALGAICAIAAGVIGYTIGKPKS